MLSYCIEHVGSFVVKSDWYCGSVPVAWLLIIEYSMSVDWVLDLHFSTYVHLFLLQRQVRRRADRSHVYMQGITKEEGINNTLCYVKTE